jgi:hypothetical protein
MAGKLSQTIGSRGEQLASLALTHYELFDQPLFDTVFLGDRWKNVDLYAELTLPDGDRAFFLAQIKSTRKPVPKIGGLRINISRGKWNALVRYRCPVYLIGVHEPTKVVFITAANRRRAKGFSRLPARNQLLPANLKLLYDEVVSFWQSCPARRPASKFKP